MNVGTNAEPLLLVLLGPTGSGKTALSLALARRVGGEIVSCDSVAVYRELEIGSAKPSVAERREIPHHLIDIVPPDAHYTAGDYSRAARAAIAGITSRGKMPVVTGGSGLYLRALLEGLFAGPARSAELRRRLRSRALERGSPHLHRILRRLDAAAADRIHANDQPKIVRAIEVSLEGRKPISQAWQSGRDPLTGYRILRLGLMPARDQLYERINKRARAMFVGGLIEETRGLMARYSPDLQGSGTRPWALNSLGYRQAAEYLSGSLTLEEAILATSVAHRNFAKRQFTWFRREPDVLWLHGFGDDPAIQREAAAVIEGNVLPTAGT